MTSPNGLTPDVTNGFVLPNAPGGSNSSGSAAGGVSRADDINGQEETGPKWRATVSLANGLVKNNVGLLLVASAQAFFAFMGVAVKILHKIDPPVSTLQVCSVVACHVSIGNQPARFIAHSCSNGD